MVLSSVDIFSKSVCLLLLLFFFLKKSFGNISRVPSSLDPDHAPCFIGPDLGPNCLQRYQQTTLVSKVYDDNSC